VIGVPSSKFGVVLSGLVVQPAKTSCGLIDVCGIKSNSSPWLSSRTWQGMISLSTNNETVCVVCVVDAAALIPWKAMKQITTGQISASTRLVRCRRRSSFI